MRSANPFFHRGPIREPAYFYGRQREIEQALNLLGNAQSVSFVGLRKMGKSSLLLHLANPGVYEQYCDADTPYCFVYVDCEGWSHLDQSDFYQMLLYHTMTALENSGHALVTMPKSPISYNQFETIIRSLTRQNIRLIFLLDEFEAIGTNPRLDFNFFSGLRGLANWLGVAYATASTKPLLQLTYAEESTVTSPFFNIFAQMRIMPFSYAETQEFLTDFDPDTIDFILELAGTHPLFLQIAAFHVLEQATSPEQSLDNESRPQIRRLFEYEAKSHWTYYWQKLTTAEQRELALLLATTHQDLAIVQRLEDMGLVRREGDRYVSLSPTFQSFVNAQTVPSLLQKPPITLEPEQHIALCNGRTLSLTPTEYTLLSCLVEKAGQVIPHATLEEQIWQDEYVGDPERFKTAVKTLRRALGNESTCIQNVRGVGYKFAPTIS